MVNRTFDISKFRKSITKSIQGLGIGFNDPTDWVSTGNFALNYLISGDFNKGIPLGKVTVFAGESGCLPESAVVTIRSARRNFGIEEVQKLETSEIQTISVGELRELYYDGTVNIEISTPDGFVLITNWYDKGILPMVSITTASGQTTTCATNHLLQSASGQWVPADGVAVGDAVITHGADADAVVAIASADDAECYDFTVAHSNHRYWGDGFSSHNSGKSYICAGNVIKSAQSQGIFVVLIDSENALDEKWLNALGVNTSEEQLLKLNMAMIDDIARTISEFMKEYKTMDESARPKVLFVIDSLGMLLTPTDVNQFEAGEMKGDMGRKPKALTSLVRNCVNMFGSYNVGMICTNHTYASQDPYSPDPNISGGAGFIYASSIVVAMKKLKLKEDEDGNKISEVRGIRSGCKIMKTRYSKPFEDIEIKIPYDTGMNPNSGLFDLFEKKKIITKEGNRYAYVDQQGEIHKYYRKEWNANINGIMDLVMAEFHLIKSIVDPAVTEEDSIDEA